MKKLTRKAYKAIFGIEKPRRLSPAKAKRAKAHNALFDAMRDELEMPSRDVFLRAADELHGKFLSNVADCPQFVVEFCQRELAAGSYTRTRLAKQKEILNAKKARG